MSVIGICFCRPVLSLVENRSVEAMRQCHVAAHAHWSITRSQRMRTDRSLSDNVLRVCPNFELFEPQFVVVLGVKCWFHNFTKWRVHVFPCLVLLRHGNQQPIILLNVAYFWMHKLNRLDKSLNLNMSSLVAGSCRVLHQYTGHLSH